MDMTEVSVELKAIAKEAAEKVVDKVLPKALELAAQQINGQIDDVLIAALKPMLIAEAKKLIAAI